MRQLMRDGISEVKFSFYGDFILPNVSVIMRDNSSILHRSPLVLMGKYLIVLVKSVFISKEFFKKLHRLNGDFKDEGRHLLHVLVQGLNAVQRHWNTLSY